MIVKVRKYNFKEFTTACFIVKSRIYCSFTFRAKGPLCYYKVPLLINKIIKHISSASSNIGTYS